jgi:tRNA/rRNA methyltransferase
MSGTDRTKQVSSGPSPVVILVAPQMGENIGMAARAMANFGLRDLRLVAPRDGWPNEKALAASSGAVEIVENASVHDTFREAIVGLNLVLATTARERGQMKQVYAPEQAMTEVRREIATGGRVGLVFGGERSGLDNEEISMCDAILTFPVNPGFASFNLAQAVLLVGYEWFRSAQGEALPFAGEIRSPRAPREMTVSFFDFLETELDEAGFFPPEKKPIMMRNLRDVFLRRDMTEQDVRTLRGAFTSLLARRRARIK